MSLSQIWGRNHSSFYRLNCNWYEIHIYKKELDEEVMIRWNYLRKMGRSWLKGQKKKSLCKSRKLQVNHMNMNPKKGLCGSSRLYIRGLPADHLNWISCRLTGVLFIEAFMDHNFCMLHLKNPYLETILEEWDWKRIYLHHCVP